MKTLGVLLLLAFGLIRALYPSLHTDEGYYVGAALRILSGDLFLTRYTFDKLLFVPYLMGPGILAAGQNALGFHLSALIAACLGWCVACDLIGELAGDRRAALVMKSLYLAAMLTPFMVFHHAAALMDPFLLLFLLLFLRAAWRGQERANVYFTLALLCKFGAFLWAPALLGFWLLTYGVTGLKQAVRAYWRSTRWLWAAALAVMLLNPYKLGPVLWFQSLMDGSRHAAGGGYLGWLGVAESLLGPSPLFWGLALAAAAATYLTWKAKDLKALALIVGPFWLHAAGLPLSGASLFPRYLYILVPQLLLLLALASRWERFRKGAMAAGGILALGLLAGVGAGRTWDYARAATMPEASGRLFYQIRDELPQGSVVHHESRLWALHPFSQRADLRPACADPHCLADAQLGRFPYERQFRLLEPGPDGNLSLAHAVPAACEQEPAPLASRRLLAADEDLTARLSESATRGLFRLAWWASSVRWQARVCPECNVTRASPNSSGVVGGTPCWLDWQADPGLPAELAVGTRSGRTLHLAGRFVVTSGAVAADDSGEGRWVLGFRLEHVTIDGFAADLVDLAPVIYGGYLIPLGPLALQDDRPGAFHAPLALDWTPGREGTSIWVRILAI